MLYARVIGHATSTVKHPTMNGWKLLIVQPLGSGENAPDGDPVVAVDTLGAGSGDNVMISSDGKFTGDTLGQRATPVRWSVIGIFDAGQNKMIATTER